MTEIEPTEYAPYYFKEFSIRPQMMAEIRRYIDEGLEPGSFLTAVICNDLAAAVGRADAENLRNLPAYVAYFYNMAPSPCWKSKKQMDWWINERRKKP